MSGKQAIAALAIVGVAFLYYKYASGAKQFSPIVMTNYGSLRGVVDSSRNGRDYYKYMGIPYAKAPVGDLRFEAPQPPEPWKGVKDADAYGSECAQVEFVVGITTGDEDCLFLNVFTPKIDANSAPLPVMFYIHGGLFVSGSANNHGPDYFMDQDIVLVTINYRLGSLGFLNTGDGIVRGNMGLKDQVKALEWVQKNIKYFGGDPDKVTIFGNSAGAASVHYQLLTKMSKGLFHKAISQSGTAHGAWALGLDPKGQATRYAQQLNCAFADRADMVSCLKKVPIQSILDLHFEITNIFREANTLFGPTLEMSNDSDTFISEHPYSIMKAGNMQRKPWIVGFASHEGLFFSSAIMKDESLLETFNQEFSSRIGPFFLFPKSISTKFANSVRNLYFGQNVEINSMTQIENFTNLATDLVFGIGAQTSLELQWKHSPTFAYFYSFKGEYSVTAILLALKGRLPSVVELVWHLFSSIVEKKIFGSNGFFNYGACHADELRILFKASSYDDIQINGKDYLFSTDLVRLWADFAKNDKTMKIQNVAWRPWSLSNQKYLSLDDKASLVKVPYENRLDFWRTMKLF